MLLVLWKILMAYIRRGGAAMPDILQRDGLTLEMLSMLSYKSELGINLKKIYIILIKKN